MNTRLLIIVLSCLFLGEAVYGMESNTKQIKFSAVKDQVAQAFIQIDGDAFSRAVKGLKSKEVSHVILTLFNDALDTNNATIIDRFTAMLRKAGCQWLKTRPELMVPLLQRILPDKNSPIKLSYTQRKLLFITASQLGIKVVVSLFLDMKMSATQEDLNGNTALSEAGNQEIPKLILATKPNVNYQNKKRRNGTYKGCKMPPG